MVWQLWRLVDDNDAAADDTRLLILDVFVHRHGPANERVFASQVLMEVNLAEVEWISVRLDCVKLALVWVLECERVPVLVKREHWIELLIGVRCLTPSAKQASFANLERVPHICDCSSELALDLNGLAWELGELDETSDSRNLSASHVTNPFTPCVV